MDAKFQPMRLLDLRIRDHVTISAGTLGFSTVVEYSRYNLFHFHRVEDIQVM